MNKLNIDNESNVATISPFNFVADKIADIKTLVNRNTEKVDEGYYDTVTRSRRVEGGFWRKLGHFVTFGLIDDYTTKEYDEEIWIENKREYVDMRTVAEGYLQPLQKNINKYDNAAKNYISKGTKTIKNDVGKKITQINEKLDEILRSLEEIKDSSAQKEEEIRITESKLQWLEGIQKRVNAIIEF